MTKAGEYQHSVWVNQFGGYFPAAAVTVSSFALPRVLSSICLWQSIRCASKFEEECFSASGSKTNKSRNHHEQQGYSRVWVRTADSVFEEAHPTGYEQGRHKGYGAVL
jgi:hypothetical protein